MSMIQRVANSRKLVLELRQWFPGLLRLKDDKDLDSMVWELDLLGEVEEEMDRTTSSSSYYYDGLAHLELAVKASPHLLKNNDSRVLNPKTGRPQVKYLEKFLKEHLRNTDLFLDGVQAEQEYWPTDERSYDNDVKIKRVIPKKDSILVVMHFKFRVDGDLDRDQIYNWGESLLRDLY